MKAARCLPLLAAAAWAVACPLKASDPGGPGTLSVAAAANLVYALDALNAGFRATAPGVTVTVATGASGSLVARSPRRPLRRPPLGGPEFAPGADQGGTGRREDPERVCGGEARPLDHEGGARCLGHRCGGAKPARAEAGDRERRDRALRQAAVQALKAIGAWDDARPKIVVGENISQTAQFVETGNADAGFVVSPWLSRRSSGAGAAGPRFPRASMSPLSSARSSRRTDPRIRRPRATSPTCTAPPRGRSSRRSVTASPRRAGWARIRAPGAEPPGPGFSLLTSRGQRWSCLI